ncbi:YybH family protein [Pseudoduganella sp. RAF53_2]|uniref:YybH family protein n=1 Tax=unclassified Pseudoduganella TaxID=2637179 RepID=UPI003F962470
MNKSFRVVGIVAVLAGMAGLATADQKADVAAVHAIDQAFLKAYTAGDADALANLYDENAVLMPPGSAAVRGKAAIRAYWAKDVADSAKAGITMSFSGEKDGGANDGTGWAAGHFTVKDKDGKQVDAGKFLSVSHKVNGKWLYVRDTWNFDTPRVKP